MYATLKSKLLNGIGDNRGSVAPMFGLMLMPMMFTIGLSLDQSRAIHVQERMQFALDAAALAAMSNNPADVNAFGQQFFAANFNSQDVVSYTATFTKTDSGEVNATVTASVEANTARLFNFNTIQVEASAVVEPQHEIVTTEEQTVTADGIPCIHVMDQNGTSFKITDSENLNAKSCIAYVRSNKGNYAMTESGGSNVEFKRIRVKGTASYSSGLKHGSSVVENDAQGEGVTGNPYNSSINDVKQSVAVGSCTDANTNKTYSSTTVAPGTYCGATKFDDVTFGAGLYVIKGGSVTKQTCTTKKGKTTCSSSTTNYDGSLELTGELDGSAGITFYLADNKTTMKTYDADEGSVLNAPTSGTTRGILIFEDSNRGQTWNWAVDSCHTSSWKGLVYLPSANVSFDVKEWPEFEVSLYANQLTLDKMEDMQWKPYSWTPFNQSSPITLEGEGEETTTTTSSTDYTDIYLKN